MQILLIEPDYKNKYPPLGLMKISSFFKERGDDVVFYKGCSREIRDEFDWDYILITSLFTFEWNCTVETIEFYKAAPSKPRIYCGGILASLMPDQLHAETGVEILTGLLDRSGTLGIPGEELIEFQIPDYSILDDIEYKYTVADSYFIHFTRGCVNRCKFCAVPKLEPEYMKYRSAVETIAEIDRLYGKKQNLLIMDNNTAASPCFDKIIEEIIEIGFQKGAKLNGRVRTVDFNQGLDARHLSLDKMKKLATLAIKPVRVAFDDIKLRGHYENSMRWAAESGLKNLSNYVLYNYKDTPQDFYERLKINVDLNEELGLNIYSFPMKYSPIEQTHRKYIGCHWNWKYLRGIKCILQATHGVVGTHKDFFERAFGKTSDEFIEIISMPEHFIINREANEEKALLWKQTYRSLSDEEKTDFEARALHGRALKMGSKYPKVEQILALYE